MWYKINNIYAWSTKVRPSNSIIESDFTTATWSSLQSQWWSDIVTTSNRGYVLDSNWLNPAGTASDTFVEIFYPFTSELKQQTKSISMYMEWQWTVWSWSGWPSIGLALNNSMSSNNTFDGGASFNNNSNYKTQGINLDGTKIATSQVQLNTGKYSMQFDYNFTTWACSLVIKVDDVEMCSYNYTFNSTQMNTIASKNYIRLRTGWGVKSSTGWNWNPITYSRIELKS